MPAVLSSVALAQSQVTVYFQSGGGLYAVQREVPAASGEAALAALCSGPTAGEAASGISSAVTPGTRLLALDLRNGAAHVDFASELLSGGVDDTRVEAIFQQVAWTLEPFGPFSAVRLTVEGAELSAYLPPAPVIAPAPDKNQEIGLQTATTGLSGRKIGLSPGHGLVWTGSSWVYERPVYCSPLSREDHHNVDLMIYLNTYLTQDGAATRPYRCLNKSQGNHSTGNPWWYMSGGYWVQSLGYPCSVYASSTGDCTLGSGASESSDSLRARPLASDYDNTDIYVSIHTNGSAGDCAGSSCPNGTCTYYDTSTEHATWGTISKNLAGAVNNAIIDVIRNRYTDSTWRDRGALDSAGGFAETRIPDRAAILIELAFHDSCDRDGLYLRDNFFRSATTWGMYKGICDYFGVTPTWDFYSYEYVSDTFPSVLSPGQSFTATVTLRNRGVLWTEAKSIRLGAVGESDPFTTSTRSIIAGEVGPGSTCTFSIPLVAPAAPGTYTTDWRMLREGVTWFGPTVSKLVQVGDLSHLPSITEQPASQAVAAGGTASFTIQAGGIPPISYQWQKDSVDLVDGGRVSGANTSNLQIQYVDTPDQGNYRCIVSNPNGSISSSTAVLTVSANIYLVESRTGGKNYAKYAETGTWADAAGKSSATGVTSGIGVRYGSTYRSVAGEKHAIFSADLPAPGRYEVFATWPANSSRRTPIVHRITHAAGTTSVNVDQAVTANVWLSLGTFTFNAGVNTGQVDMSNTGIDASGSMYADAMKWEYRGSGIAAPTVAQHPQSAGACPGGSATFTAAGSGTAPISYRWQRNGVALNNAGHYSGVTTSTLTITGADATDVAAFSCVIANFGGSTTTNSASLVLKAPTLVSLPPQPQTVNAGEAAVFTVAATGGGTLAYHWQKDGIDLANGGRCAGVLTPNLTITGAEVADAGDYRCVVTGECGAVNSDAAALTVIPRNWARGDFDLDGDVDQENFGHLQMCMSGQGTMQDDPDCQNARLDGDLDVDEDDFLIFMGCLSGPGSTADVNCGG
jgi:N-acetylmuramoyl-L-alanine amidase